MRWLPPICIAFVCAVCCPVATFAASPAATSVKGTALEVADVPGFTYLRLKTKDGEIWAATPTTSIKPGAEVTLEDVTVMNNFESKGMKRTFPTIYMGRVPGTQGMAHAGSASSGNPHGNISKAEDVGDVNLPKAAGPNARTVAEILTKSGELKGKAVVVRGKIVKYNGAIMGKNWLHIRDGSGSGADNSNDVLVTTNNQAKVGDVVLVEGIVRTDKDFGAGYSYKVLIEDAKLKK